MLCRKFATTEPELQPDTRTFRFCFSDGDVDRDGDKINPNGWHLDEFSNNPVCLFQHDSNLPPIGRASNVKVEGNRLMGDIEFATSDFAEEVFQLVSNGFIQATSVGFLPIKYDYAKGKDRPRGLDIDEQTLVEISLVSVPANPRALIEAAMAQGLSTKALSIIDKTPLPVNNQSKEVEHIMTIASLLANVEKEVRRLKLLQKESAPEEMDESESSDPNLLVRSAHEHMKCAKGLRKSADELHDKALKCLKAALDSDGDDDDDDKPDDKPDEKAEGDEEGDGDDDLEKRLARIRATVLNAGR